MKKIPSVTKLKEKRASLLRHIPSEEHANYRIPLNVDKNMLRFLFFYLSLFFFLCLFFCAEIWRMFLVTSIYALVCITIRDKDYFYGCTSGLQLALPVESICIIMKRNISWPASRYSRMLDECWNVEMVQQSENFVL